MASGEIHIRIEGKAGRITLNRPKALNALTYPMANAIEAAMLAWRDDPAVALIIIDAEGERAFCAGGDIEELYRTGMAGDFGFGRKFWSDEYRLNALIAGFPKPFVAFMQGFVMGGGVGISCHGSHRIVCESTQIAMPECGIGLVPDVGGSYLLANAPGRMGEYFGLTGARMNAGDALCAGFADSFVPADQWSALKSELVQSGSTACIDRFETAAPPSPVAALADAIDGKFSGASALECVAALEASGEEWASGAARLIRKGCPLSVACAFEIIRRVREMQTVEQALEQELCFTWRSMSDGEFLEGIRAQIIDKDRNPQWRVARLEDVTPGMIAAMLAPIEARQRASVQGEGA